VAAGDLAAELAASYPDTPAQTIESFLAEMVARRVLLTGLRPPMTVTDTLGHVIGQLSAVDAGNIAAVAPAVRALHEIQATLARHTGATSTARRGLRASAAEAMTAQSSIAEQPLAVDLLLDCSLTLPSEVAHEAENAAGALARLTPFPSGSLAWQDYHARFLERFGTGALVPVLRLTDPDTGLGFPAGYRGSLAPRQAPALTDKDEQLLIPAVGVSLPRGQAADQPSGGRAVYTRWLRTRPSASTSRTKTACLPSPSRRTRKAYPSGPVKASSNTVRICGSWAHNQRTNSRCACLPSTRPSSWSRWLSAIRD